MWLTGEKLNSITRLSPRIASNGRSLMVQGRLFKCCKSIRKKYGTKCRILSPVDEIFWTEFFKKELLYSKKWVNK